MFFFLSKTLGVLLLPANFLILAGAAGAILLLTGFVSLGRKVVIASTLVLAFCAFSPIGNLLLYPLEARFPSCDGGQGAPDGIIVLGGAIETDLSAAHGTAVFSSSVDRIIAAVALARRYPNARVVFSGGSLNLVYDDKAREADFAVQIFDSLGLAKERLTIERLSRNTYENAAFTRQLISPKSGERWFLITSAYHMPRSVGVFRKVGLDVEPCPVDWRTGERGDLLRISPLSLEGLGRADLGLREWAGLLAYWISGKTSEFFPAPNQR